MQRYYDNCVELARCRVPIFRNGNNNRRRRRCVAFTHNTIECRRTPHVGYFVTIKL